MKPRSFRRNLILMLIGISIPVVSSAMIFIFNLPGPIYFIVGALLFVFYTLWKAKRENEKAPKRFAIAGGIIGFFIAIGFPALAPMAGAAFFDHSAGVSLLFFPSSVFWGTLNGRISVGNVFFVYATAIVFNALVYALYGCTFYYLSKLFVKDRGAA